MALLGTPLLVVLALLAVGVPVVTLLVWGRLGERRLVVVPTRAALLIASQLSAVLLVAALLNDYGYFYASWSDLLGRGSSSTAITAPEGVAGRGASAPGTRSGATSGVRVLGALTGAPTSASGGRTLSVRITGAVSGLSSQAYVWLPPGYARSRATLPGVEVMSGYPGSSLGLVERMGYPARLLAEVRAHRAHPAVLVMLRPAVTFPRDTECTDVPAGPQVETFLGVDVPDAVSSAFRVRRDGWGVMGDSTGGYCSAKLAMDHVDRFTAGVALSGYFHTLHDRTTGDLWGGSPVVRDLNDLEWRLRHQPAPPAQLFVATSRTERGKQGYVDSHRFIGLVRPPMRVTSLVLASGGHNFGAWGREMAPALDWLSARLR